MAKWVRLNANTGSKPQLWELAGDRKHRAMLVHLLSLMYVARYPQLEGLIRRKALRAMHGRKSDADALVRVGLWLEVDEGWVVLDWFETQLERPRVAISKTLRASIYGRDGYACRNCGALDSLSIDHIIPWSHGGSNNPDNLQTLCLSCNSSKGARV